MSTPYDRPLRFKLNALRSYQIWLLSLHSVVIMLIIFFANLFGLQKIILPSALLLSLFWNWQKLRMLPHKLYQKADLDWVIEDQAGKLHNSSLIPDAYVSAWLVVLRFTVSDNKKLSVVILPYMLDRDSFRRLAVYLRMTNLSGLTNE